MRLDRITMTRFAEELKRTQTVIQPFGALEEHGPHLPLGTDTMQVEAVAEQAAAEVVGRSIFYNHSAFDGDDAAPGQSDDAAVAPDKEALLPGQVATFANYTSFGRGLNGVMLDVFTPTGTLTDGDFECRILDNDPEVTGPEAQVSDQKPRKPPPPVNRSLF